MASLRTIQSYSYCTKASIILQSHFRLYPRGAGERLSETPARHPQSSIELECKTLRLTHSWYDCAPPSERPTDRPSEGAGSEALSEGVAQSEGVFRTHLCEQTADTEPVRQTPRKEGAVRSTELESDYTSFCYLR